MCPIFWQQRGHHNFRQKGNSLGRAASDSSCVCYTSCKTMRLFREDRGKGMRWGGVGVNKGKFL